METLDFLRTVPGDRQSVLLEGQMVQEFADLMESIGARGPDVPICQIRLAAGVIGVADRDEYVSGSAVLLGYALGRYWYAEYRREACGSPFLPKPYPNGE